ncbi:SafA/ExsA family spore coat assembly protein, partial [Bacillus massiliigorillae]|uniref:SafA/ExsA family spore coat assembly protein n=1 Tax=Bacillus massiliigorillae TaxID=1243664 RepID=UPI001E5702D1
MKIHIVQKGDTLWKLAKKYGVPFEELKKLNSQLSNPDMIMPGMKIKIPGVDTTKNPASHSNTKINVHSKKETVKSGILKPIIKEAPLPNVTKPAANEAPQPNVTKPIVKEAPQPNVTKPIVKEAPLPNVTKPIVKEAPKPNITKPIAKEAPKPNVTKPIAKEAPQPNVTKPIVKEAPKPNVTKPIVKEVPKPKPMPMPQAPVVKKKPKPVPVVPQPVIPEIDINNYYMVNMANMNVQKPVEQPKPQPKQKPKPVVLQPKPKPQPKAKPMPLPQQQKPVEQAQCVAITPLMPGTGFCPPMFPMYHQFCEPIYGQMLQPLCGEESSLYESHSHMHQQFMPVAHQSMPMHPVYNAPAYQGYVSPVPEVSAHGLHHHIESSSHFGMGGLHHQESSSHHYESSSHHHHHHHSPMMMSQGENVQHGQFMMYNQPNMMLEEEDCGCDQIQASEGKGGKKAPLMPQ